MKMNKKNETQVSVALQITEGKLLKDEIEKDLQEEDCEIEMCKECETILNKKGGLGTHPNKQRTIRSDTESGEGVRP